MKTLIVEDNETSGKLLKAVLDAEGFETVLATDGHEALKILESQKIDCIVSDLMMPNIDGYRLVSKVRRDNRLKDIPFIMYTASHLSADDEEFAMRLGVTRYIQKHGSAKDIIEAISELLKQGKQVLQITNNLSEPISG